MRALSVTAFFLLAVLPLLPQVRGFARTHEEYRYPALLHVYYNALIHDGFPVRWLPELAGGFGYPSFVFYPQGFFLIASLPVAFGASEVASTAIALWLCLAVGHVAMFWIGRTLTKTRLGGWCAVLFWAFAPWHEVEIAVRGAYAEATALALGPLAVAAAIAVVSEARGRPERLTRVGAAVAFAIPMFCHPMGGVMVDAVAGCVALGTYFDHPRKSRTLRGLLVAVAAGAVLSLPALLPLATLADEVNLRLTTTGYYRATSHVIGPRQVFEGTFGYGGSTEHLDNDEMSFTPGPATIFAALVGAWSLRKRAGYLAIGIAGLCLLIMTRPFTFLWTADYPLRMLQFPWRLMAVVALALPIAASGIVAVRWRFRLWGIAALVAAAVLFQPQRFKPHPAAMTLSRANARVRTIVDSLPTQDLRFAGMDEFKPRTAVILPPRGNDPVVSNGRQPIASTLSGSHIQFTAFRPEGATIRVSQYSFPGWRIDVDGRQLVQPAAEQRFPDGTIRIALPPGPPARVDVYYDGIPYERPMLFAAVIALLAAHGIGRRPPRT